MNRVRWLMLILFLMLVGSSVPLPGALAVEDDRFRAVKRRADEPYEGWLAPRYLVTYMKSRTTAPLRTATVVSVTNQAERTCQIAVEWVRGFELTPACTMMLSVDPGVTADVCSQAIPDPLTTCNATCEPELTFHEGRAVVSSSTDEGCERVAVSARVYYTNGGDGGDLAAISDSKLVLFGKGNRGD